MKRWLVMIVLLWAGLTVQPAAVIADDLADNRIAQSAVEGRLWAALRLDDLLPILQSEALVQADDMAAILFERGSDAGWVDRVAEIHDPQRLAELLREGMTTALAEQPTEAISAGVAFYETDLGRQIARLDLQGRQAMLDSDAEAAAIAAYRDAERIGGQRVDQLQELLDQTDLIEQNVASGLNAALAFAYGFADAGGYQVPMSEAEILAETWAQEGEIRSQTQEWIMAYLYLAYAPLTEDELGAFVRFATSDAGRALWSTQMSGFDHVYRTTSYDMGQAAALHISGRQL